MEALTIKQIREACKENKYLIINFDYFSVGYNCKCIFMGKNKNLPDDKETGAYSYRPCSLEEYIQNKTPFL